MKPAIVLLCILLSSCAAMRSNYAIVTERDIPKIQGRRSILDIQDAVAYNTMDLGQAAIMSAFAGVGLGMYEGRVFYAGNAFPGYQGPEWDWYRAPHSGDAWLKIGDSDKVFRSLWTSSSKRANIYWQRYFGGRYILVYLADFIITNAVATIIRSYAKHGELRLNLEISWPEF